jgi:hypothetical protein
MLADEAGVLPTVLRAPIFFESVAVAGHSTKSSNFTLSVGF